MLAWSSKGRCSLPRARVHSRSWSVAGEPRCGAPRRRLTVERRREQPQRVDYSRSAAQRLDFWRGGMSSLHPGDAALASRPRVIPRLSARRVTRRPRSNRPSCDSVSTEDSSWPHAGLASESTEAQ